MYRLPWSWVGPKLPWKFAHAFLHLTAFILTILGLVAVFRFHNHKNTANLYSLHSWLGITTVFLFACQVGSLCLPLGSHYWVAAMGSGWGFACSSIYSLFLLPGEGLSGHILVDPAA